MIPSTRTSPTRRGLRLVILLALALLLGAAGCTLNTRPGGEPATPAPRPGASLTPAPTGASSGTVNVYLIAPDDNGQSGEPVGCGDSLVPVTRSVVLPAALDGQIAAALADLFSIKEQYYGESGLYNALYQSDLRVESVAVSGGQAAVNLAGTLLLGGECDSPRVQAQIERTASQFPGVSAVSVRVNGTPLEDLLSGRGTDG